MSNQNAPLFTSKRLGKWALPKDRTAVMAIVNLTPDSFSDGGDLINPQLFNEKVETLIAAGADIIDVGAESTRPGAAAVSAAQQLERLRPLFEMLPKIQCPVSIDTRSAEVAAVCLQAGVEIINDVSAGEFDRQMVSVINEQRPIYIAMHMRGTPQTMDMQTDYHNLIQDVMTQWQQSTAPLSSAGFPTAQLWFDPGLGFAKTAEQNWQLLRHSKDFKQLGHIQVWGPSRKRFLAVDAPLPKDRDPATHAVTTLLAIRGAQVVRVHDVRGARQAVAVAQQFNDGVCNDMVS